MSYFWGMRTANCLLAPADIHYLDSAQSISFETDCFYSLSTRTCEYLPQPLQTLVLLAPVELAGLN